MIGPAALITTIVLTVLLFLVLDQVAFLRPYKDHLWRAHGRFLLLYTALLAVNVFAGALVLTRKLGLKTTGQKLAHLDSELRARTTGIEPDGSDLDASSED